VNACIFKEIPINPFTVILANAGIQWFQGKRCATSVFQYFQIHGFGLTVVELVTP